MKRAAIYVRISRDHAGAGLGVERQEADCRQLAASKGWEVVAVYSDNDVSAYSGKRRPGYERLISAIQSGEIDSVVTWNHDRLHRRPTELESYIDACDKTGIDTYTVKAGHFDLSTPSGRAVARTLAAWAAYEVETSKGRVLAAKKLAAESGKWRGGQRPFGYEADGMTVREDEAEKVREAARRFVNGDSWRTIALDWNARKIVTANGKPWNALKVRNLSIRLRNLGLVDHNGTERYLAQWPAIISETLWDDLQTAIAASKAVYVQRGPFRKLLLKGFAFCECGNAMNVYGTKRANGVYEPAFGCRKNDDERGQIGFGGVKRIAAAVEHLVIESLFYRLEGEGLDRMMGEAASDNASLKARLADLNKATRRVEEIYRLFASGEIDFAEYKAMTSQFSTDQGSVWKH
jgi:DNA invertase Pin-like site-specific DNA recombinase